MAIHICFTKSCLRFNDVQYSFMWWLHQENLNGVNYFGKQQSEAISISLQIVNLFDTLFDIFLMWAHIYTLAH